MQALSAYIFESTPAENSRLVSVRSRRSWMYLQAVSGRLRTPIGIVAASPETRARQTLRRRRNPTWPIRTPSQLVRGESSVSLEVAHSKGRTPGPKISETRRVWHRLPEYVRITVPSLLEGVRVLSANGPAFFKDHAHLRHPQKLETRGARQAAHRHLNMNSVSRMVMSVNIQIPPRNRWPTRTG